MANTAPVLKGYGNLIDNPNGEIHANVVNLADRKTLCLAQTPHYEDSKLCTVESYWWMVRQMKARTVIHFNAPGEYRYYPTDPKQPYLQYQSKSLGVRCKKAGVRDDNNNQIATHTISVEFKGQDPYLVNVHDLEVGASGYPKAKQMAALLRTVVKQKRPVVIDCADGARYSGLLAFAALTTGFVLDEKNEASPDTMLFDKAMRQLRSQRKGCIRDAKDFAFGAMIVLEYLNLVRGEMGATSEDSKMLREGWDLWEATPTPVSVLAVLPTTEKKTDVPAATT